MEIALAFGSLVAIPFLGLLSAFRVKAAFPILAAAMLAWLLVGLGVYRGDAHLRPNIWLMGFLFGLPLLAIAWAMRDRRWARKLRSLNDGIGIVGFGLGLWAFVRHFVAPRL